MGSDHYCLKWNNHWTNLLRVFNSLLRSETFVDVTLACEGRHLNAHRLILSACSPYFKDLLLSHPDKHPIIILKDVRYTELVSLVQFIYNGEVSVDQQDLSSFLCTARELQIKGLADDSILGSLPSSLALKAPKRKLDSIYESTNSIHLSTKPNDQPTNLSIRKKVRLSPQTVSTNGDDPIDLHCKTKGNDSPPLGRRLLNEDASVSVIEVSPVAGPSGLNEELKENSTPADLTVKEEKPRICVIKQPKEKPPDDADKNSTDRKMVNNSPEVVLDELNSTIANGTRSPRSSPITTLPNSFIGPTPAGTHSPMAFLQQTLAGMRYHPHLSLLQSELLDHHQPKMPPSPALQNAGLVPPNNILNFVDFLKAMGASGGLPPQSVLAGLNSPAAMPVVLSPKTETSSPSSAITSSSRSPSRDYELKPLTCSICARIMPSIQVLEEHVRIHEEEKPYTCDQCGQRYKYQSAFQRHKEQNHTAKLPGEKPYRCDVCGQCFKYHKSFTKHRSNHDLLDNFMKAEPHDVSMKSLQEAYLPSFLQKRFSQEYANVKEESKDSFEGKELTEDDSKDSKLSRSVSENGEVKDEDMEFEEMVPDVPDEDEEDSDSGNKVLFCVQCKSVFKEIKDFDEHCKTSNCSADSLKELSGENSRSCSPQGSPLPSPRAGTSTVERNKLSSSVAFSTPPEMVCKLYRGLSPSAITNSCDPSVLNLSKLFSLSSNASGIPVVPRTAEQIRLNSIHNVSNSLNAIDEDRPFKCQYCQKGFKGRENLKLHIRTHTGEKPYNCGVCGKAFGGRSDMNRHLRIHTGEKPYPCKVCGKKFARADYLSKHITTHLGMSFPKPVHSLQQSLQNLENMQSLQSAQNLSQSQQSPQTPTTHVLSSVQNLSPAFNQTTKD